ncbi:hypothetical protein COCCU_02810 [Corynebacterium occultum]|uniref:Secreted protein n=1 Tax=Corynebacterium occultum TaxID=2675219 RepID=A0A6B8W6I1_9CORY|nr:hypothetical protein [Corynebacterium occultum]QGU06516.1 hypothetical protein COCCU_02810 [Corynebacterium occultum]
MKRFLPTITILATATLIAACTGNAEPDAVTVTVTAAPESSTPQTTQVTITQTQSSTTSSSTEPPTECTPEALSRDVDPGLDTVLYCDGQWLRGGRWQTDWVVYAYWESGRWNQYSSHGTSEVTGYPCYDLERARNDGAPEEILGMMAACG